MQAMQGFSKFSDPMHVPC